MHPINLSLATFALGMLVGATFAEAAPAEFMGMKVSEKTFTVAGGKKIVLHVTQVGPIPEENEQARFDMAGPTWDMQREGAPTYTWMFGLALKGGVRPARIIVEDVTERQPTQLVDDKAPKLHSREGNAADWTGSSEQCNITRSNECAKWMFAYNTTFKIFRMAMTLPDGTISELYQGAKFTGDTMRPLLKEMGVIR